MQNILHDDVKKSQYRGTVPKGAERFCSSLMDLLVLFNIILFNFARIPSSGIAYRAAKEGECRLSSH